MIKPKRRGPLETRKSEAQALEPRIESPRVLLGQAHDKLNGVARSRPELDDLAREAQTVLHVLAVASTEPQTPADALEVAAARKLCRAWAKDGLALSSRIAAGSMRRTSKLHAEEVARSLETALALVARDSKDGAELAHERWAALSLQTLLLLRYRLQSPVAEHVGRRRPELAGRRVPESTLRRLAPRHRETVATLRLAADNADARAADADVDQLAKRLREEMNGKGRLSAQRTVQLALQVVGFPRWDNVLRDA